MVECKRYKFIFFNLPIYIVAIFKIKCRKSKPKILLNRGIKYEI